MIGRAVRRAGGALEGELKHVVRRLAQFGVPRVLGRPPQRIAQHERVGWRAARGSHNAALVDVNE